MNMSDGSIELHMISGEESLVAARGLPPERLSPGSAEPTAVERPLSVSTLVEQCRREIQAYRRGEPSDGGYGLELVRRALVQGDQDAWAGLQKCLGELVRSWLNGHPRREVALRWQSEEDYVALAFERFWQATVQQQVAFRTFAGALVYLRASLNGAILDTLRTSSRPREISLPEPGEPYVEKRPTSRQVWEILQRALPSAAFLISANIKSKTAWLYKAVLFLIGIEERSSRSHCRNVQRNL